jgi:hypothetical protein
MGQVAALAPAVVDDPAARALLQRAQGAIQKWPEGFRGFRARIRLRGPGRESVGVVALRPAGQVEVALGDMGLEPVVAGALGYLSELLTPCFFKDGDGRYPIGLGPEDDHPLGRLVQVRRRADEIVHYRVDGKGRVRVTECQTPDRRVVTTVTEYQRATPGRVLPARVETAAWDMGTQAALGREEVVTTFARLDHVWLPASRMVTGESGPVRHALRLELSRHQLL